MSEKSFRLYIDTANYNKIAMKYITQIQIETFIVAGPTFEETREFESLIIDYDSQVVEKLQKDLNRFLKNCIFKCLFNSLK